MKGTIGGINFKIYFNMYVLIGCVYAHVCTHATAGMWRSKNNLQELVSSTIWVLGSNQSQESFLMMTFFPPKNIFYLPSFFPCSLNLGCFSYSIS